VKFKGRVAATFRMTFDFVTVEKPAAEAEIVYVVGVNAGKLYSPAEVVVAVWVAPVASDVAVTVAFPRAAPEGSST
jgi:hypothetical protein